MRDLQSMIQTRYFIADPSLIRDMEEQFSLLSSDDNSWSRTYLNPVTGERWLMHTLDSSSHGGGTEIFGRLPLPETEKLIDLVITSHYDDEVFAAGRTLLENEETKQIDFRLALISRLEQLHDKSRRISIIEYTDLDSPLNRKDILGKSYDEILSDSNYYRDIAARAKELM